MEDAGIIELFFERSEQGIRELDIKYGKACRKSSYNIVNDRQDAEECVNDAYLGAWNAIPPVKPDPLLTYICKIVRNISLNLYHRKEAAKRSSHYTIAMEEIEACIAATNAVEAEIEAVELAHIIERFLDTLTVENRVLFIRYNPTTACVLPKIVKKEIHPLTDQQTAQLLNLLKGSKYEIPLTVDLFTGLREGELLGLIWDCVDFEKGTILVNKQLRRSQRKGGTYYFSPPKNNKSRTITPAPYVMKLLQAQKVQQARQRLMAGPAWEDSGLVFTNEFGRYISYRAIFDSFKRIVKRIGLSDARIHDLRHTYAVNCIRAGDDIKTVQSNLGHATAAFTLDVYGHFTDDMRSVSAQRMEGFITNVLNL